MAKCIKEKCLGTLRRIPTWFMRAEKTKMKWICIECGKRYKDLPK